MPRRRLQIQILSSRCFGNYGFKNETIVLTAVRLLKKKRRIRRGKVPRSEERKEKKEKKERKGKRKEVSPGNKQARQRISLALS